MAKQKKGAFNSLGNFQPLSLYDQSKAKYIGYWVSLNSLDVEIWYVFKKNLFHIIYLFLKISILVTLSKFDTPISVFLFIKSQEPYSLQHFAFKIY